MPIGLARAIGTRLHRVSLDAPGVPIPDGDGGYTQTWAPLDPPLLYADIQPANARDLEKVTAGAVLATATLLITLPFHPGITLQTRVRWTDPSLRAHTAEIVGLIDHDSRCVQLTLAAVEVVN